MNTNAQSHAADPADAFEGGRSVGDPLFKLVTQSAAVLVLLLLLGIVGLLFVGSLPAFQQFGAAFLVTETWNPVREVFGALSPTFGTIVTAVIAMVVAVPLSFGVAVFLTEIAPEWLKRPVGICIELLAAVPSIIYGMWGLFVVAPVMARFVQPALIHGLGPLPVIGPLFQGPPFGIGVLSAGLILAVMILPFIASVMRDVFETVPVMLKESARGMGATTWEVVWNIVLPYTRASVVGGIMLGLGRALGETMAVTFVIGNAHRLSASLLQPGGTIASVLANEFAEASSDLYLSSLIALGFILFVITFIVLGIAKHMLSRMKAREGRTT